MMRLYLLVLVAVLILVIPSPLTISAAAKELRIGIAIDNLDDPYWQADMLAMSNSAKALGVKTVVMEADRDPNKQNQQLETMLAQKVDAIVCIPVDPSGVLQAVKKANAAKIPFVFNDRQVDSTADAKVDYGFETDNYALAHNGAEWLADYAKKNKLKLNILDLQGDLADPNVSKRTKGLTDVINANKDCMELVQSIPTEWKIEKALSGVVNAFQSRPDINCIFIHSGYLLPAVQSALKQLNRYVKAGESAHVMIADIGGYKLSLDALKEGYVDEVMSMAIVSTGIASIKAAVDLANGQKFPDEFKRDAGIVITRDNFDKNAEQTLGYYVESNKK